MRISDWSSDVCSSDLAEGLWRVSHPKFVQQHRMNAGIIVDQPILDVRFANGRVLGTIEEGFAATLSPGDRFFFSGLSLEVVRLDTPDLIVRRSDAHTSELQSLMRT